MYAANNEGINILGAVFARLSGNDENGNRLETAEMIYVSDTTDLFYLSRHAMEQLKIIGPNFPRVGAAASLSETLNKPASEDQKHSVSTTTPNNEQTAFSEEHTCNCPKRKLPPTHPKELPFEPTEENNSKMKQWLLDRFSASTFNKYPHQPLPMMTGPPIKIHVDPDAIPSTVHTPAQVPIHWREQVKKQLDDDVALGVIEKVEPNTPTTYELFGYVNQMAALGE